MLVNVYIDQNLRYQYPVLWNGQGALHFTSWQTCSTEHHLDFSRKHLQFRYDAFAFLPGKDRKIELSYIQYIEDD